jgi:acetyltransferase-like isoleucine patch superfamily enzyme
MENQPKVLSRDADLRIGEKVSWGRNVVIGPNCRSVSIGFGSFIGNDVYIDVEELSIGDYLTLHHGSIVHGKKCVIGHNNWIGHYTILDSLGGLLQLGDNVGVGAHSQLWSHMKFGDVLAGCRWSSSSELIVGNDVWFVGHCIVSPIRAADRSMLMVGSVVTKDMEANHVYGGSPARDMTDELGGQFEESVGYADKEARFQGYVEEFNQAGNASDFIRFGAETPSELDPGHTFFNLESREYTPRFTEDEYRFMRFILYERAKFTPRQ